MTISVECPPQNVASRFFVRRHVDFTSCLRPALYQNVLHRLDLLSFYFDCCQADVMTYFYFELSDFILKVRKKGIH